MQSPDLRVLFCHNFTNFLAPERSELAEGGFLKLRFPRKCSAKRAGGRL